MTEFVIFDFQFDLTLGTSCNYFVSDADAAGDMYMLKFLYGLSAFCRIISMLLLFLTFSFMDFLSTLNSSIRFDSPYTTSNSIVVGFPFM